VCVCVYSWELTTRIRNWPSFQLPGQCAKRASASEGYMYARAPDTDRRTHLFEGAVPEKAREKRLRLSVKAYLDSKCQ
jgi:hypothetical protein